MYNRLIAAALAAAVLAAPAFAHADNFGAIAYDPASGATGYSFDYADRDEAEERALDECDGDCDIAVWFQNACGALAVGDGGWGAAFGESREDAEDDAADACTQNANDCEIKVWACTTR